MPKISSVKARQLLEEALALDPQFATGYSLLSRVTANEALLGVYRNHREGLGIQPGDSGLQYSLSAHDGAGGGLERGHRVHAH